MYIDKWCRCLYETQLVSGPHCFPRTVVFQLLGKTFYTSGRLTCDSKNELHVVAISVRLMGLHSRSYRTNRLPCDLGGSWGVQREEGGIYE